MDNKIRLHINDVGTNKIEHAAVPVSIFAKILTRDFTEITKEQYIKILDKSDKIRSERDLLNKTAELNTKGKELEKTGFTEQAIKLYIQNIELGYPARHSYDRLIVLYIKDKLFEEALDITKLAIKKFPKEEKYKKRRDTLKLKIKRQSKDGIL